MKLKRFFSAILSSAIIFSYLSVFNSAVFGDAFAVTASADSYICGDYEYTVNENGTAYITAYFGESLDVVVPDILDGHTVTGIFYRAFDSYDNIVITLPETIVSIARDNFWGDVTVIASEKTKIELTGYGSLFTVYLYNKDTGTAMLYLVDRSIRTFEIPETVSGYRVTKLDEYAFNYCQNITEIVIPEFISLVGEGLFAHCSSLKKVVFPENMTKISDSFFKQCTSLETIVIPEHITTIGDGAFVGCTSLEKITMHDNLTSIGDGAFSGCEKLDNVEIPESISSIGSSVFEGCAGLKNISMHDKIMSIGDSAFKECKKLEDIRIPENITSIGSSVFKGCASLKNIALHNKLISIGGSAFRECESLENIEIPESITSIESRAFESCTSLKKITLHNKLTSIGEYAFSDCSDLADITLPDSVRTIGKYAFSNTEYYNDNSNWSEGVLYISNHVIEADSDIVSDNVIIKDGTVSIAEYAFRVAHAEFVDGYHYIVKLDISTVEIPASVVSVAQDGFVNLTEGFSIKGYENTCAQTYANENDIPFISLGSASAETGVTVSGNLSGTASYTEVELVSENDTVIAVAETVNGKYIFENVKNGEYALRVSGKKCRTRDYRIKVNDIPINIDVEIFLYGDVHSDGFVDAKDATQILRYEAGLPSVFDNNDEYLKEVANVVSTDELSAKDATQILRYEAGMKSVFDTLK